MAYIDTSKVTIPKGFFEDLNVPKLLDWLNSQPTADVVEAKRGEWFEVDDGIDIGSGKHLECSICGKWKKDRIKSNYCPNCGAKMDGGKKE